MRLAEFTAAASNQSAAASGGICLRAQLAELRQRSKTLDDSKWPKDFFSGQRRIKYNVVIFHTGINKYVQQIVLVSISDTLTSCDRVDRTFARYFRGVQNSLCECLKIL